MSLMRSAGLIAGKDLRVEARSHVVAQQVLPFGAIVLVLFAFALDPDRGVLGRAAPGLFWITVLLSALLAVSRAYSIEATNAAADGLRLSGIDGAAIFLGKTAAIAVQLAVLESILIVGVVVLYDAEIAAALPVAAAAIAATVGIAAAGTVYGALTLGAKTRETLVPLLVLPAVAPLVIGATRAFEWGFGGEPAKAWPWVQLLVVVAVIYVTIGVLAYSTLLEES